MDVLVAIVPTDWVGISHNYRHVYTFLYKSSPHTLHHPDYQLLSMLAAQHYTIVTSKIVGEWNYIFRQTVIIKFCNPLDYFSLRLQAAQYNYYLQYNIQHFLQECL